MKAKIIKQVKLNGLIKARPYTRTVSELGVILYNEKEENIAICIDTGQCCCERFSYYIPNELFKDKCITEYGVTIVVTKYTPEKSDYDMGFHAWEDGEAISFTIVGDDNIYQIWAINSQNGYYSHTVTLQGNEFVWESSI